MNSQKYKHKKQIQATESFKKTQVREKQAKFRVKTARLAHSASESLPLLCNTRPWTNTILTKRDGDNRCSDYALNAFFVYNNNDILLRTHGPYHRHKSTKSG